MPWILLANDALAAGNFLPGETSLLDRFFSLAGIFVMIGLCWVISTDRKALVLSNATSFLTSGLYAAIFAVTGWQVPPEGLLFVVMDKGVNRLIAYAGDGANFVFQSVEPHQIADPADSRPSCSSAR